MIRCLPYLFLFVLSSLPVFAQLSDSNPYYATPDSGLSQSVTPDKIHFDTKMGTSIGSRYKGGAYLRTIISPYISYWSSPHGRFQAGATITNGHTGEYHPGYGDALSLTFAIPQQSVFTQGRYKASAWLQRMDTFYELSRFNNSLNGNLQNRPFQSKGVPLYCQYKVSEDSSCVYKVASCVGWIITNFYVDNYVNRTTHKY